MWVAAGWLGSAACSLNEQETVLGLFVRVCAAASLGCVLNIQWVLGGSLPSLLAEMLIEALFDGHLLVFILSSLIC